MLVFLDNLESFVDDDFSISVWFSFFICFFTLKSVLSDLCHLYSQCFSLPLEYGGILDEDFGRWYYLIVGNYVVYKAVLPLEELDKAITNLISWRLIPIKKKKNLEGWYFARTQSESFPWKWKRFEFYWVYVLWYKMTHIIS